MINVIDYGIICCSMVDSNCYGYGGWGSGHDRVEYMMIKQSQDEKESEWYNMLCIVVHRERTLLWKSDGDLYCSNVET